MVSCVSDGTTLGISVGAVVSASVGLALDVSFDFFIDLVVVVVGIAPFLEATNGSQAAAIIPIPARVTALKKLRRLIKPLDI